MPHRHITWSEVAERLRLSRSYWLATRAPDGSPHVTPVWAVVVEDVLFVYSERSKSRLATSPMTTQCRSTCRHEDVVIVQGRFVDLGRPLTRHDVVAAIVAKYDRPMGP